MRSLPDTPVFSRSDARALGWSDSALTRAIAGGRLIPVRRGQLTRPGTVDQRIAALAAARDRAGSAISHRSALLMHGLPVVGRTPHRPEITVPPNGPGTALAAHLHRATVHPDDLVSIDGVPVLSVARTVVDVGRSSPTSTAVAAIDAALQRELATLDEIDAVVLRCWNWPGIRRALRALRLADGRAESALESVSRLVISWMRLPTPDLQTLVLDRYGHAAGRLDFYWDKVGVAGEADGRGKYDRRDVLTAEKERQELLEDHSLVFVRWGWDEAVYRPHLLRSRLESGFKRGRARDRSGFPRQWSISRPKPGTRRENVILGR